jgi:hypothetical protein
VPSGQRTYGEEGANDLIYDAGTVLNSTASK